MSLAIFVALLLLLSLSSASVKFCDSPSFAAYIDSLDQDPTPFLEVRSRDACGRGDHSSRVTFSNLTAGGLVFIDNFVGTASSPLIQPVEIVQLASYKEAVFLYTQATQPTPNDDFDGNFTITLRCFTEAVEPNVVGDVEIILALQGANSSVNFTVGFTLENVVNNGSTSYPLPGYVRVTYPTSSSNIAVAALFDMNAVVDGASVMMNDANTILLPPVSSSLQLVIPIAAADSASRSFSLNSLTFDSNEDCSEDDSSNNSLWSRAYRYWDNHLWLQIAGPAGFTAIVLLIIILVVLCCCLLCCLVIVVVVIVVVVLVVIVVLIVVLVIAAGGGSVISIILGKKRSRSEGRKTIIYAGGPQLSSSSEDGYMEEEYDDNVEVDEEDENVFDEDESESPGEEEEQEEEQSESEESDVDNEYESEEEDDY